MNEFLKSQPCNVRGCESHKNISIAKPNFVTWGGLELIIWLCIEHQQILDKMKADAEAEAEAQARGDINK